VNIGSKGPSDPGLGTTIGERSRALLMKGLDSDSEVEADDTVYQSKYILYLWLTSDFLP